jgi:ABC-type microcin C transport system permease subunit YejE
MILIPQQWRTLDRTIRTEQAQICLFQVLFGEMVCADRPELLKNKIYITIHVQIQKLINEFVNEFKRKFIYKSMNKSINK